MTRGAWRGSDGDFLLKVQFRAIARPRTIGELPIAIDANFANPILGSFRGPTLASGGATDVQKQACYRGLFSTPAFGIYFDCE